MAGKAGTGCKTKDSEDKGKPETSPRDEPERHQDQQESEETLASSTNLHTERGGGLNPSMEEELRALHRVVLEYISSVEEFQHHMGQFGGDVEDTATVLSEVRGSLEEVRASFEELRRVFVEASAQMEELRDFFDDLQGGNDHDDAGSL